MKGVWYECQVLVGHNAVAYDKLRCKNNEQQIAKSRSCQRPVNQRNTICISVSYWPLILRKLQTAYDIELYQTTEPIQFYGTVVLLEIIKGEHIMSCYVVLRRTELKIGFINKITELQARLLRWQWTLWEKVWKQKVLVMESIKIGMTLMRIYRLYWGENVNVVCICEEMLDVLVGYI